MTAELPADTVARRRAGDDRLVVVAVSLTAMFVFLWLAERVIQSGYVRRDIAVLEAGDAWRRGGWLSQLVLWLVGFLPERNLRQTALSLLGAVAGGALVGMLYGRLRANGWFAIGALLMVTAFCADALVIYTVTGASLAIPLLAAVAALIPSIRRLESVGDVQSAIGIGLTLPLLLLASPTTTPLILPLAIGSALADPDGRRDPRAFFAMTLVAILPTIIVATAVIGFAAQAGYDPSAVIGAYVRDYDRIVVGDWPRMLGAIGFFAPVLVVPIIYCVAPNVGEKRYVWSAFAVVALPLYLVVGASVLPWSYPTWVAPLTLLGTFVSWLAVARLKLWLRVIALLMLVLSAGLSWLANPFWSDPVWLGALKSVLPH